MTSSKMINLRNRIDILKSNLIQAKKKQRYHELEKINALITELKKEILEIEFPNKLKNIMEMEQIKEDIKKGKRIEVTKADDTISDLISTLELFHDEFNKGYARIEGKQIYEIQSEYFKGYLRFRYNELFKKWIGNDRLKTILTSIESIAVFKRTEYKLHNRLCWYLGDIWYDLGNWTAVKISKEGWNIIKNPPILFRHYAHQIPQVIPVKSDLCIGNLQRFINMNIESQFLFIVNLISCFIPDFPHPIFSIYGEQGTSKTTNARIIKKLVDPSKMEVISIPNDKNEFIQILDHNYVCIFDNVSQLSQWQSDLLCRAITGDGSSKRMLYSNDEDIIFNYIRIAAINGINIVGNRPDLLDRSILLETQFIPNNMRKTELQFWNKFDEIKPQLLGVIFDSISNAMKIYPNIKLDTLNRMADFTKWSYAISATFNQDDLKLDDVFLKIYTANITRQKDEALDNDIIAELLFKILEARSTYKTTASQLLVDLNAQAEIENINTKVKSFPKQPNVLMKRLNTLKNGLRSKGIEYETISDGKKRNIEFTNSNIKEEEIKVDDGSGYDDF